MDGDLAPLEHIVSLAEKYDALLVLDEAHAIGVLGQGGGLCRELRKRADVLLGTLSKSLGSAGGFVATSRTHARHGNLKYSLPSIDLATHPEEAEEVADIMSRISG